MDARGIQLLMLRKGTTIKGVNVNVKMNIGDECENEGFRLII